MLLSEVPLLLLLLLLLLLALSTLKELLGTSQGSMFCWDSEWLAACASVASVGCEIASGSPPVMPSAMAGFLSALAAVVRAVSAA